MTLPKVNAHAIAAFRRFYSLLPRSSDPTLLILKVHLLVEEQVRAFIDARLPNPSPIQAARFDCHQAICLAEALSSENIHPNMWEAARKLNALRNDVAHKIEPTGILDRMAHICKIVGLASGIATSNPLGSEASKLDDFSFAASILYNELSLFVKRQPAEVLQLVSKIN